MNNIDTLLKKVREELEHRSCPCLFDVERVVKEWAKDDSPTRAELAEALREMLTAVGYWEATYEVEMARAREVLARHDKEAT